MLYPPTPLKEILRRAHVPPVSELMKPVRQGGLPDFLCQHDIVPRIHGMPVPEPGNLLEQAIETGQVWQDHDDPIRIETFDSRHDVLSLFVNTDPETLHLSSYRDKHCLTICANGRPMISLPASTNDFSIDDIRIVQTA